MEGVDRLLRHCLHCLPHQHCQVIACTRGSLLLHFSANNQAPCCNRSYIGHRMHRITCSKTYLNTQRGCVRPPSPATTHAAARHHACTCTIICHCVRAPQIGITPFLFYLAALFYHGGNQQAQRPCWVLANPDPSLPKFYAMLFRGDNAPHAYSPHPTSICSSHSHFLADYSASCRVRMLFVFTFARGPLTYTRTATLVHPSARQASSRRLLGPLTLTHTCDVMLCVLGDVMALVAHSSLRLGGSSAT